MPLFHATRNPLIVESPIRHRVRDFSGESVYLRNAEEFLRDSKPPDLPCRYSSWFASDTAANSAAYLQAENRRRTLAGPHSDESRILLYEVNMLAPSRHPMFLVNVMAAKLEVGDMETAERLASEYWTPSDRWTFWEYLGNEMTVIAQQPSPSALEQALAGLTYQHQAKLADEFLAET